MSLNRASGVETRFYAAFPPDVRETYPNPGRMPLNVSRQAVQLWQHAAGAGQVAKCAGIVPVPPAGFFRAVMVARSSRRNGFELEAQPRNDGYAPADASTKKPSSYTQRLAQEAGLSGSQIP
ncbi:hypothetical protein [Pigmentiphaga sp.]|uniref:hypothetical protein n=1 Tax=Pigmentiphaga sp. TaxID=1977564 RepID=UPI00128E0628|nr:hypothetical protein [Pigmentiphaga sp.]MPS28546.1 hypothetical protein [Alcaligenaceae bacterium SAGV5]MPS52292.1 hypothetical protein [Alcaligenaceae bacterium SAGV3]MPT58065.1 hypothetical protein [Alcaligenaceae bacterium]